MCLYHSAPRSPRNWTGWSILQGERSYSMVCGNGGGTKEVGQRQNLRGSKATQPKRAERSPSTPKVNETLAQLTGDKIFSKQTPTADFGRSLWHCRHGYLQRLSHSWDAIASITSYSASRASPEHFQCRISELLNGLQGVQCQMDDILVFGKDEAEHDSQLQAVLHRIKDAGVIFNPEK